MDPLKAVFGTEDDEEILLRMLAAVLRKVAQPTGRLSDTKLVAVQQSLHWLAATCGLTASSRSAIERVAADASRDAKIIDHATRFICGDTLLAGRVLIESFRVAVSSKSLEARQLDWLILLAEKSKVPQSQFRDVYCRYCYDPFGGERATAALRELEVSRHARLEEIKQRYRELSKQFHPDRHPGVSDEAKRKFASRFDAITKAFGLLTEILEEGRWCRTHDQVSLVAAAHELVVDCFFCESRIRLPNEKGVLASARCPLCKSLTAFPKSLAERFLHCVPTREKRTAGDHPKSAPNRSQPTEKHKPKRPLRSSRDSPPSHSGSAGVVFATGGLVLVLAIAAIGSKLNAVRSPSPEGRRGASDTASGQPQPQPKSSREPNSSAPSPHSPPTTAGQQDAYATSLESHYSQASALAETGRLADAAEVLRLALADTAAPDKRHLEVWVKCQSLLRSLLLRASADQSVLSAWSLSLRREAVEVCRAMMTQYGRHGAHGKARSQFELAKREIASLLAVVSRGVREIPQVVNQDLDFQTAKLLQTKSQLYWEYGRVTRNSEAIETSVAVAGQVVDFCEEAFGKHSEQAVVARRNLQRKTDTPRLTDGEDDIFR